MKAFLLAAITLATLGMAGSAQATTTVTFDDAAGVALTGQYFGTGQSFTDGGLIFTNQGSGYAGVSDGTAPNSNGTNNLVLGWGPTDILAITPVGGGEFDLNSLEMAISYYDPYATETVTINGIPLVITQTLTTYTLNLDNVSQVDISGVSSGSGYWTADNINYNAPEPISLSLLGVGLAGLGLLRRRRAA